MTHQAGMPAAMSRAQCIFKGSQLIRLGSLHVYRNPLYSFLIPNLGVSLFEPFDLLI